MARVKLIQERGDVAPEQHAVFDELAALRGRISGPSSVVLYSPGLARPWNQISEFLHRLSIVEPFAAELAVCATAREFDCGYIWAAHVGQARNAGVSEQAIAAVAGDAAIGDLSDSESLVIGYTRGLIRGRRADGAIFDQLLEAHGPRWLLELTAWIGRYAALAGILNAFEVTPAPDAEKLTPETSGSTPDATNISAPPASPRVRAITARDQVAAADQAVFDAVAEGRGNVRGPFSLLMYSPLLCRSVLDVSNQLRQDAFLSAAVRELATIATARERDCPYVWAAHAPAARRAGVDEAVITAVRDRQAPSDAGALEADVIDFVRQLLRQHRVDQALFDRLQAQLSTPGLVELAAVMGHYVFVTSVLNAFEMAPAPDAEVLPLA